MLYKPAHRQGGSLMIASTQRPVGNPHQPSNDVVVPVASGVKSTYGHTE
jgi:hypothetical protein